MLNLRTQQQEKEFFELSELPFPTLPQKSPGSWKFSVASNLPCLFNVGNGLKVRPRPDAGLRPLSRNNAEQIPEFLFSLCGQP